MCHSICIARFIHVFGHDRRNFRSPQIRHFGNSPIPTTADSVTIEKSVITIPGCITCFITSRSCHFTSATCLIWSVDPALRFILISGVPPRERAPVMISPSMIVELPELPCKWTD